MTINKPKASGAEQQLDDERDLADASSTNIILKPLDVNSVVRLIESWENDPDEEDQHMTLAYLSKARCECWG